ncbi:MAG TPA: NAD(P)H-dependent oxidoreductase [Chitinophagaceae bacterium]
MRKKIFAISGSASRDSANLKLLNQLTTQVAEELELTIFDRLSTLPHFDPELSIENTPIEIINFRKSIEEADAVIICTPEYIYSIPSGLKNAIEWCVSTTIFSEKPLGIITASANGEKGHEELQLIMKTVNALFSDHTVLLIPGIKGKISESGVISDEKTANELSNFMNAFKQLIGI